MMCDNKERLVEYLYDEMAGVERQAFEVHLAACADCRSEVEGLRATRTRVAAWAPPDVGLGFSIVRERSQTPRRWWQPAPAWGFAAAAVLVVAAASALANLEIRYGNGGVSVHTGWTRESAAPPVTGPAPSREALGLREELAALKAEVSQLRSSATTPAPVPAVGAPASDGKVLRQVSDLLAQSEQRQQQELARRIRQFTIEIDAQRRVDLATFQQGLQGASGAEAANHREIMSMLYRVAATQAK